MKMNLRFPALLLALLILPGAAAADPVTAILVSIKAFAATSIYAAFAVQLGFSMVFTALAAAFAQTEKSASPGIKTEATSSGGANPQTFVLGRYATGGNAAAPPYSHPNSGAVPNQFLTYVIDVSDLPGVTMSRMIVAGEYVEDFQASAGTHDFEGMFNAGRPNAFYSWHDGSQVAADPYMMENYAADPDRPWSADMVGSGIAYAVVTFKYNREMFNGLPGVRFEVDGVPLYDPRLDSTVGGSGAHRWGNPATYGPTGNPMVMIYNIMRGITLPEGSIWGGRAAVDDLPLADWFAAMNECDVVISLADGGTELQYMAGIEVSLAEEPATVIEQLLNACSAQISEMGGVFKPRVGPPALPVYFFTDADVVADEAQRLMPYPGIDGVYNALHASHPAPDAFWEITDAPPLYNPEWEMEDGGRRLVADVQLPSVASATQVQRLMAAWIKDERRFRRHSLALPPGAAVLEPLDTAAWTSARNGYAAKVFEIGETSDAFHTLVQSVSMRERDALDFVWVPGSDEIAVSHPGVIVTAPAIPVLTGWGVNAVTLIDDTGASRRAAIELTWDGAGLDQGQVVEYEVRPLGQLGLVAQGAIADPSTGTRIVSEGILPAVLLEARAYLATAQGGGWTDWDAVFTDDVRLGSVDLGLGAVTGPEIGDSVKTRTNVMRVASLDLSTSSQFGSNYGQAVGDIFSFDTVPYDLDLNPNNPVIFEISGYISNLETIKGIIRVSVLGRIGAGAFEPISQGLTYSRLHSAGSAVREKENFSMKLIDDAASISGIKDFDEYDEYRIMMDCLDTPGNAQDIGIRDVIVEMKQVNLV